MTQAALVGRVPGGHRPLEVGEVLLRDVDGLVLVRLPMSTTPFGTWTDIGPTSSGV